MRAKAAENRCAVLVVDDDSTLAETLQEFLQEEGWPVEVALSGAEAVARLDANPALCVALVDLVMPVAGGMDVMGQLRARNPEMAVIIMTGYGTIETAVEAIKCGAEDYLTKPFDRDAVRKKVGRLMEVFALRRRVEQLESSLGDCFCFDTLISMSPLMQRVLERARAASGSDASVLLLGETGVGKELLARAIHRASRRAASPFLPVNCGALPRDLVESELFGFRRGAFTGAYADAPGVFLSANGGTVFLDEVAEMPKEAQVKLLRVLQEGELRAVGSARPVRVDVRIVCATNRPLAAVRSEYLREDFFYRVSTVVLEIPPLRARPEDVVALAQHFGGLLARRYGRQISLARSAIEFLLGHPFPGNVRELENMLDGAAALSLDDPQTITDRDLRILAASNPSPPPSGAFPEQPLSMERLEIFAIQQALRLCGGNRTKAATLLGISRDTLYRKLRRSQDAAH